MNSTNLNKTGEIWPEIFRGALIGEIKARGVSTFLKFKGKVGQTSERVLHVGLRPWCRRTPQPIWHPSSLIIPLAIFNFQFSIFNPPLSIFLSLKRGSHVYSSIFIDNLLRAHQDLKRPMGVFLRVAYLVSSVKWKLEKGDTHLIDLTRAGKIMVGSGQEN